MVPDVLGDAGATWERSAPWFPLIRALGIPVALVAQNGAEGHVATWEHAREWDVLFVGGAPVCPGCGWVRTGTPARRASCPRCRRTLWEWKLSPAAKLCVTRDACRHVGAR